MGKTYVGNTSDESVIPKKIYAGDASNHSVPCKIAYCGDSNGKSVEVWRNTSLPSTYQKVEYIYNTNGTEYINTGIKPNSSTSIYVDFQIKNITATSLYNHFMGCVQSNANNYASVLHHSNNQNYIRYNWAGQEGGLYPEQTMTRHVLEVNRDRDGKTYVDNTKLIDSTATFSTVSNSYLLFAYMESGTVYISNVIKYHLYAFKVWQSNVMVRDMYPCYLKSDDQLVGMYDLIGGQFYGNNGTGIFYKGPDVN